MRGAQDVVRQTFPFFATTNISNQETKLKDGEQTEHLSNETGMSLNRWKIEMESPVNGILGFQAWSSYIHNLRAGALTICGNLVFSDIDIHKQIN